MMEAERKSPRYVLGVNPGPHDAAAALLRDGELVAMVEQERLSRNRHAFGEPASDAVAACLAQAGIDLGAVAEVAVGWDIPLLREIEGASFDEGRFKARLFGRAEASGQPFPPLRFVSHHIAHAASAFYTSGMKDAAILVADGRGESVATTVASGGPGGIEVIETWGTHMSLGHLYGCAAAWAGLTVWGAGKLMGLAAYGQPGQPVPLAAADRGYTVADAPPGDSPAASHLRQLGSRLLEGFQERNYPFVPGDRADVMAYANFAASIQGGLEEVMLALAKQARKESGHSNLVLAGGVALNCAANGALIRSGMFEEVWIPPFPHDAGVSLGAALFAEHSFRGAGAPPRLPHAFWAPETDDPAEALDGLSGCETSRHSDGELVELAAQHLAEGRLIGWWQDRAEVGQRALGARSILCDPRSREALVRMNEVKGREVWRPLAPAVPAEHTGVLSDEPLPAAAGFMLTAWPVHERAQPLLPAAVHVDGTARPQVVQPDQARYHQTIEAFRERTGIPAVINTSFNLAGEPIVLSAHDAVATFMRSDLDVLVIGDVLAHKPLTDSSNRSADLRARVQSEATEPLRSGARISR